MDGYSLVRMLRNILSEASDSGWLDVKSNYDYLYEAVLRTIERIDLLTTTDTITTAEDDTTYNLNANFLKLYMKDNRGKYFVKYSDGTNTYWIYFKSYESIYLANNTTSVLIPDSFSIIDATPLTRVTGSATSTATQSNGEATLTSTTGDFSTIEAGDIIHNTTDGSHGIVISKTSSTVLITALYDGTNNYWTSTDAYIIVPTLRYQLILDPPPSTASHTITVPYVYKPDPVYSCTLTTGYRGYPVPYEYAPAIVKYAAWVYKYRDREPQYGDSFYKYWDAEVRRLSKGHRDATQKKGYSVNLIKSATESGSSD